MSKFQLFADSVYSLTMKYGSEYRTGIKTPDALINAQVKFLLSDSRYCSQNSNGSLECWVMYLDGGEFNWTLNSLDNIVSAVKVLYENVYSPEAVRILALKAERAKRWSERKTVRKNRILDMQRLKRGETLNIPLRRRPASSLNVR